MTTEEILAAVDGAYRDIATMLAHQAESLEAIAERETTRDPVSAAYAAGAAAGFRAIVRAFDRQAA